MMNNDKIIINRIIARPSVQIPRDGYYSLASSDAVNLWDL